MEFSLNTDRSPFLVIGSFSFTFGKETHNIDVLSLPDDQKKQLVYNINRQVLLTKDKEGLAALVRSMQPDPVEQVDNQPPAPQQVVAPTVPLQIDLKPLKAILRKTVSTVKKEAAQLSPGQVRRLLELEKETKNRKSVVLFLEEMVDKHAASVLGLFAPEGGTVDDTVDWKSDPSKHDPLRSTQITDVVESEEELVTFDVGELETDEEGALLISQEVLYQLEE